ncbi:MAG: pyridine nucleotide-disulfide oxidoreductase [Mycobacterium sp.]|nr:pyridine nucleotide-disulfide oxidoreductase [Mycobacterium sp.]
MNRTIDGGAPSRTRAESRETRGEPLTAGYPMGMTIVSNDVEQLLGAGPDAVMVLIEGRVEVIGRDELDTDEYRGALEVISRHDLLERAGGTELTDNEMEEQAAALDVAVSELGG